MAPPEDGIGPARAELTHGVLLRLAYDGTDFHGWQRQPGLRTVQGTVERAIEALRARHGGLKGVSRTDAGVHARDQVVAFATDRDMPARAWVRALNGHLPDDVAVCAAEPCPPDYDPRRHARAKLYRYHMIAGPTRDPLRRRSAWHIGPPLSRRDRTERGRSIHDYLDIDSMQRAADQLVGTHDFHAFRQSDDARENTVRTMLAVRVLAEPEGVADELVVEVHGTAFMKNMVRIFAGTLQDVGRQRIAPERIAEFLRPEATRAELGPTAPAHGLTLVRVELEDAPQRAASWPSG